MKAEIEHETAFFKNAVIAAINVPENVVINKEENFKKVHILEQGIDIIESKVEPELKKLPKFKENKIGNVVDDGNNAAV
jgi:hypothetical protein